MTRDVQLQELLSEVRSLREEIRTLRADMRQEKPDPGAGAETRLLREIHRATAGGPFTVADLMLDAELTELGAGDEALRVAIVDACGAYNTRSVGKTLARLEGRRIDGVRIERLNVTREGIRWILRDL